MRVMVEPLVYTRVEAAYSPSRQGGFQTVYWGAGLSPDDVADIERRVQCFSPPIKGAERFQFFVLESGMGVVTRSVAIQADAAITDYYQRRGAFIAHALVLSAHDLARLGNNPLPLFVQSLWISTPQAMLRTLGTTPGPIPHRRVSINKLSPPSTHWTSAEAYRLVQLAYDAHRLQRTVRCIPIVGTAEAIWETLTTLFALAPPDLRRPGPFDAGGQWRDDSAVPL